MQRVVVLIFFWCYFCAPSTSILAQSDSLSESESALQRGTYFRAFSLSTGLAVQQGPFAGIQGIFLIPGVRADVILEVRASYNPFLTDGFFTAIITFPFVSSLKPGLTLSFAGSGSLLGEFGGVSKNSIFSTLIGWHGGYAERLRYHAGVGPAWRGKNGGPTTILALEAEAGFSYVIPGF